ncbi:cysteine-rich CWC family protein [Colwellia sp. MB02u-9]|uniref:cysteine-rich CWC family protein n=1 Tax=Colwellia sp. MB02u-9 TaxID=2759823 RepID=UPI0015F48DE8|nr:cysteine-rich CWC family protein [Colwellia sp. MB02u-9]MBA6295746.1 cysteine-rich CWC family protein [Colwellia sp. MB02u-9]
MSAIDTNQCPLCQQNNLCAVNGNEPCWCVSRDVKRDLLTQVPAALSGKSCICKSCIDKFNFNKVINKS